MVTGLIDVEAMVGSHDAQTETKEAVCAGDEGGCDVAAGEDEDGEGEASLFSDNLLKGLKGESLSKYLTEPSGSALRS